MKFNKKIAIVLLVLTSLTTQKVLSQNKIDTELLIGTWVFDYDKSILEMDKQMKSRFDKIEIKTSIEKAYKGRKISFMKDGTYLIETSNEKKTNIKWSLKKNNIVELVNERGSKKTYLISLVNSNKLVLIPEIMINKKGNALFSKHYFTKP